MAKLIRKLLASRAPRAILFELNIVDLSRLDASALAELGISHADVVDVARRTMI